MLLIAILFIAGYILITFEDTIGVNKTAIALLTAVLCWTAYIFQEANPLLIPEQLMSHMGDIAGILFFLMGAMAIVELIAAHDGFRIIINAIKTNNKRKLLWLISFLTFFLSSIIDNLTTTIVMISLLRNLIKEENDRWLFTGMVIIAANAGGAWSPIGDITTTMLWIGGQITSMQIILKLFFPSLVCMILPLLIVSRKMKGEAERPSGTVSGKAISINPNYRNFIFFFGLGILVLIPGFKSLTNLPPFMGMLLGLGILWILSEIQQKDRYPSDKNPLSLVYALRKIDIQSILFFLGILLSVSALQSAGILKELALFLDRNIQNQSMIVILIGLCSAVIDNVPLVAACIGMYDLTHFPTDHFFWQFIAYCAGTGGSILIIGSAAGVVAMGMENIRFFWYLRKVTWLALVGYFAGAFTYILLFN